MNGASVPLITIDGDVIIRHALCVLGAIRPGESMGEAGMDVARMELRGLLATIHLALAERLSPIFPERR